MKRTHLMFFLGLAALARLGMSQESRPAPRVVILHTNDFHGQVYPLREKGGLAALAWKLKQLRAEETAKGARVFIVDCGDFFQGTPEGDLTEGRLMVDAYNEIGTDVLCVGNHDFDFGPHVLEAAAKRAKFPFLGANVRDKNGLPPYLKEKVAFDDAQIEFLGLLTSEMPHVTQEKARVGLAFLLEKDVLAKLMPEAKYRTVVLSHVGHDVEQELAKSYRLAAWIGGHSHRKMQSRCGETLYSQAGSRGEAIGIVEIGEKTTGRFVAFSPKDGEDEKVKAIIAHYAPEIDRVMNEEIGEIEQDATREGRGSSMLGNWLCDLMRKSTGAEIAFHNRGGIRADLRKGKVRLRDLYQVSPFKNTIVTMKLKGSDIVDLLTHAAGSKYQLEVSGLEFKTDLSSVQVGGYPLDRDRDYTVVTNSFLAKGGDTHDVFMRGRDVKDTLLDLLDLHKEDVRKNSPIRLRFEQRIHAP